MCSVNECKLPDYDNHKECILHCEKILTLDDNKEEFADFKMGLARYLAAYLCGKSGKWYAYQIDDGCSIDELVDYFAKINQSKSLEDPKNKAITDGLRKEVIPLKGIHFPFIDSADNLNDYLPVLSLFGGIKFQDCHFIDQHNLVLPQTGCFFEDCHFKNQHLVESYLEIPGNEGLPIYRGCNFYNTVGVMGTPQHKQEITRPLFEDCFFEGDETLLQISHCVFNTSLFSSDPHIIYNPKQTCKLKAFELKNCTFNTPFVLNNCIFLESVVLEDCTFEEKFEFKHNVVKKYEQENCNVGDNKVADFFDTFFKESFHIEKSIFKGFVGFEKCTFGEKNGDNKKQAESSESNQALFKYVTFLDFANFRDAKFFHGLDIGSSNFKNPPNFLKAEIGHDLENSSRESYRIIKHSFDDVGNYIEANEVFALEMTKYRKELSQLKGSSIKKGIFWFNSFFSNFGQSILRPASALVVTSIIAAFVYSDFVDELPLWSINGDTTWTRYAIDGLNHLADSLVFSSLLKDGYEFISLIFGVLLSVFSWMTIVAFKRLTRR